VRASETLLAAVAGSGTNDAAYGIGCTLRHVMYESASCQAPCFFAFVLWKLFPRATIR
jgi:hypothetical protein